MKLSDFVEGELLNTIIAVKFSIVMFSWQPQPSPLISRFIYSAGLRSKLNGKKYSYTGLRNRSPITESDINHDIPDLTFYRFI